MLSQLLQSLSIPKYILLKTIAKFALSFSIIVLFWGIAWLLIRLINRNVIDKTVVYRLRKLIQYIFGSIVVFIFIQIWFINIHLGTFLGLLSAGLAIAFKDYLTNFVAWFYIMFHNPFKVGDRIKISEVKGDVVDVRLLSFSILEIKTLGSIGEQSTGRMILIPNHKVLTETLVNYYNSFEYTWSEIHIIITFESNLEKAKNILLQVANNKFGDLAKKAEKIVQKASMKYMIKYTYFTPTVYVDIKDNGVLLTLRFLSEPRKTRINVSILNEEILFLFNKETDIYLAYPTQRLLKDAKDKDSIIKDDDI